MCLRLRQREREGERKKWNGDCEREFDFALLSDRRMCVYFIKKNEVGVRAFVLEVREWRRRRQTKTSIVREDKNPTNSTPETFFYNQHQVLFTHEIQLT